MEFFSLFSTIFFNIAIIVGLLLLIYLFFFSGIRARKDLKPVKYISYKKDHFQENFEFICEFCGSKVSSAGEKCPTCGGNFGKNKEYQLKKTGHASKIFRVYESSGGSHYTGNRIYK